MNTAEKEYTLHELISTRRSPRAFAPTPVEEEKIDSLFEAARWTASAMNEQPWRYIYATKENPEAFARILDCLVPANQVWAQHAPVLIISIVKTLSGNTPKLNSHALYDVGAANTALALQATHLGLFVHQMAGLDAQKVHSHYQLPEGYEPVVILAVGYLGNPEQLPEHLKVRELAPRVRNEKSNFAFKNNWQQ